MSTIEVTPVLYSDTSCEGFAVENIDFIRQYRKILLEIEEGCKKLKQVETPLIHEFFPGLYVRKIFIPSGTFAISKTHRCAYYNVVLTGRANIMVDGSIKRVSAPDMFASPPGVKRVGYILEDMIWATFHPTSETDLDVLERQLILTEEEESQFLTAEIRELSKEEKT